MLRAEQGPCEPSKGFVSKSGERERERESEREKEGQRELDKARERTREKTRERESWQQTMDDNLDAARNCGGSTQTKVGPSSWGLFLTCCTR